MRPLDLGGVRVEKFDDGPNLRFALNRLLPGSSIELQDELIAIYGDRHIDIEARAIRLAMHSFLVRTRHHIILVDACLGNDKERPARPHFHHRATDYLARLAELGVSPADIDFVMCTHMHSDHVGWNTVLQDGRWVPTFPNARYVMARKEYEHWAELAKSGPVGELHGSFEDSVLPVVAAGQAFICDEADFICDNVRLEYFTGHSPGNVIVHLEGSSGSAVCSGDIVHSPIQFRYPDLLTGCPDPIAARESRLRLFDMIANTPTVMLPAHFQDPTGGRLRRSGGGFHYDFID